MTMLAPPPPRPARASRKPPQEPAPLSIRTERVLLHGVSWATYSKLLDDLGDQNVRMTYDQGLLEIDVPHPEHERYKKLIGTMIDLLSLELDVPIGRLGSTTFRKKRLKKGTEPDECYYVQNERKVRHKLDLDLTRDPPPDLVVEIDITSPSVPKEPIYAVLGVSEIWRFDGTRLQFLHRNPQGEYAPHNTSLAFPFLKVADFERFVRKFPKMDENRVFRAWRDWLRQPGRRKK